jgi:hypothetical protein
MFAALCRRVTCVRQFVAATAIFGWVVYTTIIGLHLIAITEPDAAMLIMVTVASVLLSASSLSWKLT